MNLLFPRFSKRALGSLLITAVAGALIAGAYGIVHDQITYAISPEYFTQLKFVQFSHADPGLGDRMFVVAIGFLATWWVGFIAGWILWRLGVDKEGNPPKLPDILRRFTIIVATGMVCGVIGFFYGRVRLRSEDGIGNWLPYTESIGVTDPAAFYTVAQIHNFGYGGAVLGLIFAGIAVRRARNRQALA